MFLFFKLPPLFDEGKKSVMGVATVFFEQGGVLPAQDSPPRIGDNKVRVGNNLRQVGEEFRIVVFLADVDFQHHEGIQ